MLALPLPQPFQVAASPAIVAGRCALAPNAGEADLLDSFAASETDRCYGTVL